MVLLTACKPSDPKAAAEAEALDYVRIVTIAASNVYTEAGKSIPPTPCTDPIFNMKKTSKFLTINRCTVKYNSDQSYIVTALFNDGIAVISDMTGTRRVEVDQLPSTK